MTFYCKKDQEFDFVVSQKIKVIVKYIEPIENSDFRMKEIYSKKEA